MASTSQSQTNGVPSSSAAGPSQSTSQPTQNTTTSGSATVQNTQATGATTSTGISGTAGPLPSSPTLPHAPRPRDSRTIELLLTSQGVTSYDQRVPLLLLDFAYRHTSSVLNDALHLSSDPYVTHAGGRPSGSSGAVPSAPALQDATVTTSAINLAIASRQAFQFRGGAGGHNGGGGASKDWLQELARERNRTVLPRILANEWGVRLPNERFVLSGQAWSLKESWDEGDDGYSEEEEEEEDMADIFAKKDGAADAGADGDDRGGFDELLEDDVGDEDMEGME
ncbi:TFIID-31kDa-domain-containing protein [Hypoxylon cercidicola]|nr:TFIID-31kDa-domain-containing protein [Hypoxylon cercidicola]